MTKKNIIVLSVTILAVAGFYIYLYRDYFKKPSIHISHTFRPKPMTRNPVPNADEDEDNNRLIFSTQHDLRLKCVKVVLLNEFQTNKFAHPVWSLISDSNSIPTRVFAYGGRIRGMHPDVKGAKADHLEPNVPYRLMIEADALSGQHDFIVTEDNHIAQ